jgi:hypothetical protein
MEPLMPEILDLDIVDLDLDESPDESESELVELPEEELDEVGGGQSSAAILD